MTQPQIPALASAGAPEFGFPDDPSAFLRGLKLCKARNKAAGGGGVLSGRWHDDSVIAPADGA